MHSKIIPLLQLAIFTAVFAAIYILYRLAASFSPVAANIISLLLIALIAYMYFVEPNMLTVSHISLSFENYPLRNTLKILQISDLHYDRDAIIYRKTLKKIEDENPDIIVITGDFIGELRNGKSVEFCKKIVSIGKPVYAIMGNWDHKYPSINGLYNVLSKIGITVLVNESKEIYPRFYLAGTDDPYFGYANLDETFKKVPENAFKLLLTHSPDIVYDALKYKPNLILCGHTHGGQVKVPFLKAIYVPSKYGTRFLEGMFKINTTYMYVNRGIGESHLHLRFLSPPEVTVFTLHK